MRSLSIHHGRELIARGAERQWGVVTRGQLRAAGLGDTAIDRRLADGRLRRLHRGVYALGHAALRIEGVWLAAVLACGPDAALSHRTAAALWGLFDTRVLDVTATGARRRPGIVTHRGRLAAADRTVRRGMPVTTVARTLLDLGEVLERAELTRTLEQAMRLKLYSRRALDEAASRAAGRRALRPLRACLDELEPRRARTRSELERRALALISDHGLPAPEVNARLLGLEVDLHWPDRRLVVELDGHAFHTTPAEFERDRRRDADLTAAGHRVVRFTWRHLEDEPEWVAARLRQLLA